MRLKKSESKVHQISTLKTKRIQKCLNVIKKKDVKRETAVFNVYYKCSLIFGSLIEIFFIKESSDDRVDALQWSLICNHVGEARKLNKYMCIIEHKILL